MPTTPNKIKALNPKSNKPTKKKQRRSQKSLCYYLLYFTTHHIGSGGAVGVCGVCRGPAHGPCVVVGVPRAQGLRLKTPLPLIYHQVYRHLAIQAGDVSVVEIVT